MLAPGNYVQWKSRIKRHIDTKPNHELIHYCLTNPLCKLAYADKEVPISEGSPVTRTERYQETYKNVSQDIRDQLNAEVEAVQIILTGIDNDMYSTVDACPNACECEKQLIVYHPQNNPTHYTQNSSTRSQQATTRNRGKAIVNYPQPIYDQKPSMVVKDDEMSKDKEIDKLMALISLSSTRYENQRIGNVAGARETVDQELEMHYLHMAQIQEVSPDTADSGPIFDAEPLQKVSNDDHYNVFAIESAHSEQSKPVHDTYPIEQDAHTMIIDSLDMSYDREEIDHNDDNHDLDNERELLASLIEKLKCEIDESKNRNKFSETSNKLLIEKLKENKVKVLDNIVYKTGQSVQTMNMLNNKCRTSFAKPEFLKKAQRENPHLYDIGCYNDNLSLMLAFESNKVIRLEKESRSKLSDLIRPFDYDKLNNLYDLFVPQREKSYEQRYFSERSRLSHTSVNNGNSNESFNKQATLLEKQMDESIPLQLKSNPIRDRVMHNNSQGKKQEVEDKRRNVKLSKNKMFVTACNDSLNAKTLNVNFVSDTCARRDRPIHRRLWVLKAHDEKSQASNYALMVH
nr:hypothetical protein [Tanacetum cinerariifolium]